MLAMAHQEEEQQVLSLEDYFTGRTRAWGIFQDRFGRLRRRFEVDIDGSWDGETLTLVEDFVFDDGELDTRTWHIKKIADTVYRGNAEGVIGTAEGVVKGNSFNWCYDFALKVGKKTINVRFNDWFFLQSDGIMINRAKVTKFGLLLGELTLVFARP